MDHLDHIVRICTAIQCFHRYSGLQSAMTLRNNPHGRYNRLNQLKVYLISKQVFYSVYEALDSLPIEEKFGLRSQLCRAAVSIGANIAESQGRRTIADQNHFIDISRGSLTEVIFYLDICKEKGWIKNDKFTQLINLLQDLDVRLFNFTQSKQRSSY